MQRFFNLREGAKEGAAQMVFSERDAPNSYMVRVNKQVNKTFFLYISQPLICRFRHICPLKAVVVFFNRLPLWQDAFLGMRGNSKWIGEGRLIDRIFLEFRSLSTDKVKVDFRCTDRGRGADDGRVTVTAAFQASLPRPSVICKYS